MQRVGRALNLRAHHPGGFHKANVALNRVAAHTQNFYAILAFSPFGKGAKCYEIASRRGVAFDMNLTRRLVLATGWNDEALPIVSTQGALDVNAETLKQVERDFDVGPGNQLAHHFNANIAAGHERQRHQQRR